MYISEYLYCALQIMKNLLSFRVGALLILVVILELSFSLLLRPSPLATLAAVAKEGFFSTFSCTELPEFPETIKLYLN